MEKTATSYKKIKNKIYYIYIDLKLNFLIFYSKIILKIVDTTTGDRLKSFLKLLKMNNPCFLKSKEMAIMYIQHYLKYIHTNFSFSQLYKNL